MSRTERIIIVVGLLALLIIPTLVLFLSHPLTEPTAMTTQGIPTPGAPGAQHWHASMILYVDGKAFDFGSKKYMLQSKLVHFEDDDPFVVHKHTTGITIPYFLSTLKIFMEKGCIDFQNLDVPEVYCESATSTLRMLVNGEEVPSPEKYDIQNDDRILVYLGPLAGVQLKFLYNQVPPVPAFREKTLDELQRELTEGGFLK